MRMPSLQYDAVRYAPPAAMHSGPAADDIGFVRNEYKENAFHSHSKPETLCAAGFCWLGTSVCQSALYGAEEFQCCARFVRMRLTG